LYLAAVCTDDPAEQSRVAEMVGESTIRASFFGIAASYTVEDVMALSRRLTDNGGPATIEDSRAALQLDLMGLFDEADLDDPSNERKVSAVVQRRQLRSTTRLARGQAQLDRTIAAVEHNADVRVAGERSRADAAERNRQGEAKRADEGEQSAIYWKRLALGGIPAVAVLVVALVITAVGVINPVGLLLVVGGLAYYVSLLLGFAGDARAKARPFLVKALAELGGSLFIGIAVGLLLK
jgi:hypothetical protein